MMKTGNKTESGSFLKELVGALFSRENVTFCILLLFGIICFVASGILNANNQALLKNCEFVVSGRVIKADQKEYAWTTTVTAEYWLDEKKYRTKGEANTGQEVNTDIDVHYNPDKPRQAYAGNRPPTKVIYMSGLFGLLLCTAAVRLKSPPDNKTKR